jgi:O-antigen/teichoic acid export membrane protein
MTGVWRAARFFAGDSAARAVTFVVLVASARHLGPSEFGRFSFVYGVVALALLVGDMGMTPLMMRRLSRRERFDGSAFWSAVVTNAVFGAVAYCGLIALFLAIFPDRAKILAIYGGVLLIQACATSIDAALFARGRSPVVGAVRLAGNVVLAVAAITALATQHSAEGLAIAFVVGGATKLALGCIAARRVVAAGSVRVRLVRVMLRHSLPFAAAAIASFLYFRVDVVLLGILSSARSVGEYAAAYRILDGVILLPGAMAYTLFPEWVKRPSDLTQMRLVMRMMVAAALAIGFCLFSWADLLMRSLYGGQFLAGATVLKISAVALPFLFIDVLAVWVAYAHLRERAVIIIGSASFAVNLGLNLLLIPRYDIRGAAVATVVSEIANAVGYAFLFRQSIRRNLPIVTGEARRMAVSLALVAASATLLHLRLLPWGVALAVAAVGLAPLVPRRSWLRRAVPPPLEMNS